jgi:hypothetical protein
LTIAEVDDGVDDDKLTVPAGPMYNTTGRGPVFTVSVALFRVMLDSRQAITSSCDPFGFGSNVLMQPGRGVVAEEDV